MPACFSFAGMLAAIVAECGEENQRQANRGNVVYIVQCKDTRVLGAKGTDGREINIDQ